MPGNAQIGAAARTVLRIQSLQSREVNPRSPLSPFDELNSTAAQIEPFKGFPGVF